MKKKLLIIIFILNFFNLFSEDIKMNSSVHTGIIYILKNIIPKYYRLTEEGFDWDLKENMLIEPFKLERKKLYECSCMLLHGYPPVCPYQYASDFISIHPFFRSDDEFRSRQDLRINQAIKKVIDGNLYEYWIITMGDKGKPYKYDYFYLTKAKDVFSTREIIQVSTQYQNSYKLSSGEILDLTIENLFIVSAISPWLGYQSYLNTQYENKILGWHGRTPYLRNMNIFEKYYYKNIKRAERKW